MTNFTKIALSIAAIASLNACGGGSSTPTTTTTDTITDTTTTTGCTTYTTPSSTTLAGDLTGCTLLTSDKEWILDGLVVVTTSSELKIEAGTTIKGMPGSADETSYLIVDKGAKIMAEGTAEKPIVFTSVEETTAVGQWGGLTIIGNAADDQVGPYEVNIAFTAGTSNPADNSGILKYVQILNSGITMAEKKEINGLSLVGVGSGTTIDNITIDYSDDDGIEAWGGTVNMSNINISHCTDDYFDIDEGYTGTVTNLTITQVAGTAATKGKAGNASIEMSGITAGTFDGLTIVQDASEKEGVVYFKDAGIGGHFKNASITDNVTVAGAGALHSNDVVNKDAISFENVALKGASTEYVTGPSAVAIIEKFNSGLNNTPDL